MEEILKEKVLGYAVVIEQDENGVYVVHIPELPGCHTQGESPEEALKNISKAIKLYLEYSESQILFHWKCTPESFLYGQSPYTSRQGVHMAKPIRATPTLKGEDAVRFVKGMLREQKNPSKARVATIRRALRSFGYFEKQMSKA